MDSSRLATQPLLTALGLSAFVYVAFRLFRFVWPTEAGRRPLPPGPPGRFIVGNLGQLNLDKPEEDYIRWGKEYDSDVIHLKVLNQHMICLNSAEAATDLLDRKGSNYCDRPRFTLFEVMGWGLTLTFLPWGPRFKLHRKMFQNAFTQSNIKGFRDIQLYEARKAVRSLVEDPTDWKDITLLLTTSIIFSIAFGQEIRDKSSPYCDMSAAANEATSNGGIAGTSLVDVFPPARFLPGWLNPSAALRHARDSKKAIQTIHDVPWAAAMRDIEAGTARRSFMQAHWDRHVEDARAGRAPEATVADIKGATGAVFIAGGNSTWSTILSCMLFLTKFPDAQRRIQAEIDAAVLVADDSNNGHPDPNIVRLPSFDDRPRLAYLDRFVHEVMRVLPLNPLVIPHRSLQDDVYRGMRIPAGSIVFANAKAMNDDPATYAEPDRFDPDRYLRGEPYPVGNFGFGRRKCPGNLLALASVYIFLATLMAVFHLEKEIGPDGEEIEPLPDVTVGLGGHPAPFKCRPRVRNEARAELLRQMREQE